MFSRPGFRTSEFLVALLTAVGALVAALLDYIGSHDAGTLSVVAAVAFVVSRGLAKYETRPGGTIPPAA